MSPLDANHRIAKLITQIILAATLIFYLAMCAIFSLFTGEFTLSPVAHYVLALFCAAMTVIAEGLILILKIRANTGFW